MKMIVILKNERTRFSNMDSFNGDGLKKNNRRSRKNSKWTYWKFS